MPQNIANQAPGIQQSNNMCLGASTLPMCVGDYQFIEKIATGGMAEVYLASTFHNTRARFAIKIIRTNLSGQPRFQDMLVNEAKLATSLHHENVCRVHGHGEDGG